MNIMMQCMKIKYINTIYEWNLSVLKFEISRNELLITSFVHLECMLEITQSSTASTLVSIKTPTNSSNTIMIEVNYKSKQEEIRHQNLICQCNEPKDGIQPIYGNKFFLIIFVLLNPQNEYTWLTYEPLIRLIYELSKPLKRKGKQ